MIFLSVVEWDMTVILWGETLPTEVQTVSNFLPPQNNVALTILINISLHRISFIS